MVTATAPTFGPQTIWGLDALQLHAHYWASLGVQVVRQGEPSQIVPHAELFLLTDPHTLPLFRLNQIVQMLEWVEPQLITLRVHDTRERTYLERAISDDSDKFLRFERVYDASGRTTRVMLTPERELAELWMAAPDPVTGYRRVKRFVDKSDRVTRSVEGKLFDRTTDDEIAAFLSELVKRWKRPDATIGRAQHFEANGVWVDPDAKIDPGARLHGSVWVGAGRQINKGDVLVGPAVIWDDPAARPEVSKIDWMTIEPTQPPMDVQVQSRATSLYLATKRCMDIVLSIVGLLCTSFVFPFAMLAIWLEDGRPFFFGHMRETVGSREFRCWKFRSMRKDAHLMKDVIAKLNMVDGPQVFIKDDPRITKVGRFLRKYNMDEFPQFWCVLKGDMSMVGPRPSPRKENQFCPAWREARLSVRPGITGLWQTRRTRNHGSDFQEWIKYDIEYVETMSLWRDIKIMYKTLEQVVRKGTRN